VPSLKSSPPPLTRPIFCHVRPDPTSNSWLFSRGFLIALIIEAVSASETSVTFCQTTWRNIPETVVVNPTLINFIFNTFSHNISELNLAVTLSRRCYGKTETPVVSVFVSKRRRRFRFNHKCLSDARRLDRTQSGYRWKSHYVSGSPVRCSITRLHTPITAFGFASTPSTGITVRVRLMLQSPAVFEITTTLWLNRFSIYVTEMNYNENYGVREGSGIRQYVTGAFISKFNCRKMCFCR
jgi:hypothetical protein